MMGAGKQNKIFKALITNVFLIAFQKYVGKASASEREQIWNDFLNDYFKKGNSYINAMNRSAEELNIAP